MAALIKLCLIVCAVTWDFTVMAAPLGRFPAATFSWVLRELARAGACPEGCERFSDFAPHPPDAFLSKINSLPDIECQPDTHFTCREFSELRHKKKGPSLLRA
ncbi:hypothetical protein AVEN_37377-1 [Araneus ventricosus]|uniref:Uncharacterized protein n=1 Tax=Araneus ventricosus TaxID=182803 RepID=A0A4Y2MED1_ARAVE|nr:hypothetical protein AVEN_37377-1 [Araneus ventricosus]